MGCVFQRKIREALIRARFDSRWLGECKVRLGKRLVDMLTRSKRWPNGRRFFLVALLVFNSTIVGFQHYFGTVDFRQ